LNRNLEHIDALIASCLQGNASEEELQELELWLAESDDNSAYFKDLEFVFHATASVHESKQVNVDAAWDKVNQKIGAKPKQGFLGRASWQIAASLIGIVILSIFSYFWLIKSPQKEIYSFINGAEVQTVYLPDSTKIKLQPFAEIHALSMDSDRRYRLKGTAYFEIRKRSEQFELYANDLLIRDIGTAFTVAIDSDSTFVSVSEGIVELKNTKQKKLQVKAGESAYYVPADEELNIQDAKPQIQTGSFQFEELQLQEVCARLEAHYGVDIAWDEEIELCTISVRFDKESLSTILEIIALTLDIDWEEEGNVYRFTGTACH